MPVALTNELSQVVPERKTRQRIHNAANIVYDDAAQQRADCRPAYLSRREPRGNVLHRSGGDQENGDSCGCEVVRKQISFNRKSEVEEQQK
jgi:hypothetical protein